MSVLADCNVLAISSVHNYTEEHWNRSVESNVTSGGLHVIIYEENGAHSHLLHLSAAVPLKSLAGGW